MSVGVVTIGRNEGERLRRCLQSLVGRAAHIVYVDSGSTDDSVAMARALGVEVIDLDMATPFTMARARNAGYAHLLQSVPGVRYVQFVDGDCEVIHGWLETAGRTLDERSDVAAVCGRVRERHPGASIYNRLCDLEWDTPVGEARACGGNTMMRVAALRQVGLFNPALIAGEEPELCVRLRQAGWKILRLDAEMVLHDSAMMHFSQWWKRMRRGGHACAQGAWMHGRSAERHNVRPLLSVLLWGMMLPLLALLLAWPTYGLSLLLLIGYAWLGWRVYRHQRRRGRSAGDARLNARFTVMAKFAQLLGVLQFAINHLLRRQTGLIEYKSAVEPSEAEPARPG